MMIRGKAASLNGLNCLLESFFPSSVVHGPAHRAHAWLPLCIAGTAKRQGQYGETLSSELIVWFELGAEDRLVG